MTDPAQLADHRAIWESKASLRAVYADFYRLIVAACVPGLSLEIGGGTGNFKAFTNDVVSTDIQSAPWLDAVCDAHRLPFENAAFANLVLMDVLHHLERPRLFLAEAARVLRSGGRLILAEPAITPVSWIAYNYFHPEPVDMSADPLTAGTLDPGRDPFDANQAVPTLLFGQGRQGRTALAQLFPEFTIVETRFTSLFAYPLTGGFRPWCLVPAGAVGGLLKLEKLVLPLLGPLMAFRMFVVLERQ